MTLFAALVCLGFSFVALALGFLAFMLFGALAGVEFGNVMEISLLMLMLACLSGGAAGFVVSAILVVSRL